MAATKEKVWYQSKTIWLNIAGILIIVLQFVNQQFIVDPDIQTIILAIINLLIRFKTDRPIYLTK